MRYRWVCFSPPQPDTVSLCGCRSRARPVCYWSELAPANSQNSILPTSFSLKSATDTGWAPRHLNRFVKYDTGSSRCWTGEKWNFLLPLSGGWLRRSANPAIQYECISMLFWGNCGGYLLFFPPYPFLFAWITWRKYKANIKNPFNWFPKGPSQASKNLSQV